MCSQLNRRSDRLALNHGFLFFFLSAAAGTLFSSLTLIVQLQKSILIILNISTFRKKLITALNLVGSMLELVAITSPPYHSILPIFQSPTLPATGANIRLKTGCVCHARTCSVAALSTSICSTIFRTQIILWPSVSGTFNSHQSIYTCGLVLPNSCNLFFVK